MDFRTLINLVESAITKSQLGALLDHLTDPSLPKRKDKTLSRNKLVPISTKVEELSLLVHFTDHPKEIMQSGFLGVTELTQLGLTKNQGKEKSINGYNFAYPALSKDAKYQQSKYETATTYSYGSYAICFKAPYILVSHLTDKDTQAIFLGADFQKEKAVVMQRTWNWLKSCVADGTLDLSEPNVMEKVRNLPDYYFPPTGVPKDINELKTILKHNMTFWTVYANSSMTKILFQGSYPKAIAYVETLF